MKPIIFNTEMVRAILEGRKTMTRRVVSENVLDRYHKHVEYCDYAVSQGKPCYRRYEKQFFKDYARYAIGEIGDTLYVRETFAGTWTPADGKCGYVYKADGQPPDFPYWGHFWIPSFHMHKEAARLFLKVIDIRAERLQNITKQQAVAEGIGDLFLDNVACYNVKPISTESIAIKQFELLWNSTIKRHNLDKHGWHANPWVWVVEFKIEYFIPSM